MRKDDYQVIRERTRPLEMLGDINEEEVEGITLMYLEADKNYSLNLLFKALQATFRRDLENEERSILK